MRKSLYKVLFSICLAFFFTGILSANSSDVVRVGYYNFPNYQEGSSEDIYKSGYGYEYLQLLSQNIGWQYEYVYGSRSNLISQLKTGQIDLIVGLSKEEALDGSISFSKNPTVEAGYFIFQYSDSSILNASEPQSFDGKKIGVLAKSRGEALLKKYAQTNNLKFETIEYKDHIAIRTGILNGECNAFVATDVELDNLNGLLIIAKIGDTQMYAGINKAKPELLEILNVAQDRIRNANPFILDELKNKYFNSFVVRKNLTTNEKDFVREIKKINVGYIDDYLPFCCTDKNGNVTGVVTDLFEKIKDNFDLNDLEINYISCKTLTEAKQNLENNKIDVIFPFYYDFWYAEKNGIQISDKIYVFSVDYVTRNDSKNTQDRKVAVSKTSPVQEGFIKSNNIPIEIVYFENYNQCIKAVMKGVVSGTFLNGFQSTNFIKKMKNAPLKIVETPDDCGICFATRQNDVSLLSFLNHGLRLIDQEDVTSIVYDNSYRHIKFSLTSFINQHIVEVWISVIVLFITLAFICYFYIKKITQRNIIITKQKQLLENLLRKEVISNETISSISRMYFCIYYIDMTNLTFMEMHSNSKSMHTIINESGDIKEKMNSLLQYLVDPTYADVMKEFTDISTLRERLAENKYVCQEFLGRRIGWCEGFFIASNKDNNGYYSHVIFAVRSIKKEKELLVKSTTDELTGCYNRRNYEEDINRYKINKMEDDLIYVSMDLNGLKNINDSLGHEAGDELIVGAADCIRKCFSNFGKIYRIGGDEFIAIIHVPKRMIARIYKKFEIQLLQWRGKYSDSLAVSTGFAAKADFPKASFQDLTKTAEKRMYQAKEQYYATKGVDRRGNQAAFDALRGTFTKILKINLQTLEYAILVINDPVDSENYEYKTITEWFSVFAKSNYLHEDDRKDFIEKTNIEYIKTHISREKNEYICVNYRRFNGECFKKVMLEIVPGKEYSDLNQICYLYVKNVD